MKFLKKGFLFLALLGFFTSSFAINDLKYISTEKSEGDFCLLEKGKISQIIYSENDYPGVIRAAYDLQSDLEKVSEIKPPVSTSINAECNTAIIIGTLGTSQLIDQIVSEKNIDVSDLTNKWETFIIQTIENPTPEISQALLIIGSDKRGSIYGIYDLSEKAGVSPWYWWADVPVKTKTSIYVKKGSYTLGEPKVKYRGIFINDEAPALSGWSSEKFGGFNHKFYAHVFELILRLKGNFLWPAMWGSAFYDDDSLNAVLADEYGVVISTSHHEPLMRAHAEWRKYGNGPWNYEKNPEELQKFWRTGIERMGSNESIVTIGMRGDGDEAMSEEAAIPLLEKIVHDQRQIIEEVTGKPAKETPQVWALYKEVQEYYDKGMRVPEDITLLLCDDNWGNVRILPPANAEKREGGYGMYYHFDFVGGPRNYKWLNTNQIERVWEQMWLTYKHGVDRIWLVNVGDIKPMEFPISFFLDFAWNPNNWSANDLPQYYTQWAAEQFGEKHAKEIGELIALYTKYNSRRKPEMIDTTTYSLTNYNEAEKIVEEYNTLLQKAKKLGVLLPANQKDSYHQLVLFPIEACANLNEMYYAAALNHLYADQKRNETNKTAEKTAKHFKNDSLLSVYYHTEIADGKWNHMMSQIRIGYTYWQQPQKASMPKVKTIDVPAEGKLALTIEGTENWWPKEGNKIMLPEFDGINKQTHYIELFNQGQSPVEFKIKSKSKWLKLSATKGKLEQTTKVLVEVDWENCPDESTKGEFEVVGENVKMVVYAPIKICEPNNAKGFIENNGVISIEATNYSKAKSTDQIQFTTIPNLGKTGSAVTTHPVTANKQTIDKDAAHLAYPVFIQEEGEYKLKVFLSPTLNFQKSEGLQFAVSLDNNEPIEINIHDDAKEPDWKYPFWWNSAVGNNIIVKKINFDITESGNHILKYWPIDQGVVLQKIVLEKKTIQKPNYLGPPESKFVLVK